MRDWLIGLLGGHTSGYGGNLLDMIEESYDEITRLRVELKETQDKIKQTKEESFRCGERMMNSTMEAMRIELTKAKEQILTYEQKEAKKLLGVVALVANETQKQSAKNVMEWAKPKRGRPKKVSK